MKLRFLTAYDENGQDIEEILQYWNEDTECWDDVPHVRYRYDSAFQDYHP